MIIKRMVLLVLLAGGLYGASLLAESPGFRVPAGTKAPTDTLTTLPAILTQVGTQSQPPATQVPSQILRIAVIDTGYTEGTVHFRSSPQVRAGNVLAILEEGEVIIFLASSQAGWSLVAWGGVEGYVYSDYLREAAGN